MTPTEAILAHVNNKVPRDDTFRALLAHQGWWVPRPLGATLPTILVTDQAMTATIWAFSSNEAYQRACAKLTTEAIGSVTVTGFLDELICQDDPRVACLRIDPESPIAFSIQTDALAIFRALARAVRVERAIVAQDHRAVRGYGAYLVPYFGVLGQGHNLITLPSERGQMLAAFTAHDALERFLATGTEENRAAVKVVAVDGEQLFGIVGNVASGVLVNPAGPHTLGLDQATCQAIAAAD